MRALHDKTPLVSELLLVILFTLLLCAPMFDYAFGGMFSYVDEISCLIMAMFALLSRSHSRGDSHTKRIVLCLGMICFLGLCGNFIYGFQSNFLAIAADLFTCVKVFISYLAARILLFGRWRCLSAFRLIGQAFLAVAMAGLILHVAGIVNMGSGRVMFGVPCYQFLFSHPTNLAAYCVGFAAILFADEKPHRGWICLACILLVATQRAKAVAMAFVILFFLFYGITKRDDHQPSKLVFIFLAIGSAVLAMDQIQEYFFTSTSARSLLMQDGLEIAARLFPLGSGFASFGTYMSGVYYSPLYYEFGLNNVWGLWPSNPSFVSDSFWPAVIAQFGILGLVAVALLLIESFKSISQDAKRCGVRFAAYGIIPIYLLILSTADASFFNFYGPFYALAIAAIVNRSTIEIQS